MVDEALVPAIVTCVLFAKPWFCKVMTFVVVLTVTAGLYEVTKVAGRVAVLIWKFVTVELLKEDPVVRVYIP